MRAELSTLFFFSGHYINSAKTERHCTNVTLLLGLFLIIGEKHEQHTLREPPRKATHFA